MRSHKILMLSTILAAMAASVPIASFAQEAERPARLEMVAGSDIPRVILLEQAARRLAVETTEVRDVGAQRWLLLVGVVEQVIGDDQDETNEVTASAGTDVTGDPSMLIRVAADGEWSMNSSQDLLTLKPAEIPELDPKDYADAYDPFDDDSDDAELVSVILIGQDSAIRPFGARMLDAAGGPAGGSRYFAVVKDDDDVSLEPGQQVLLRVANPVGGDQAKIVPYSSVIYDVAGNSWLYTNPEPLVFIRQKIVIERILGSLVVLSAGPEAGTRIVSVGAAELMGVEQNIGS